MRINIVRKLFIALLVLAPLFSYVGCKKQAKCGCDGDVLYTLKGSPAYVYFNENGSSIYFTLTVDPYSTYNFCNPAEMFPKLAKYKSGDVLDVYGDVFWDCNYVMQASSSSYGTYYKIYQIMGTDISINPYGK
jgi:glycosidase